MPIIFVYIGELFSLNESVPTQKVYFEYFVNECFYKTITAVAYIEANIGVR